MNVPAWRRSEQLTTNLAGAGPPGVSGRPVRGDRRGRWQRDAPRGCGCTLPRCAQRDAPHTIACRTGAARNTGAAQARGQFLVFTDEDCAPVPNWLRALAARLAPGRAIGGP